jgi:hypothetical protein
MTPALIKRAYEEAAALLAADCDSADLPLDLSEEDESLVREFIRNEIVTELRASAERRWRLRLDRSAKLGKPVKMNPGLYGTIRKAWKS